MTTNSNEERNATESNPTEPIKLTKGEQYDLDKLDCVDWTGDDTGLLCWNYFDGDGVYLGPDDDGVEPLFVVR